MPPKIRKNRKCRAAILPEHAPGLYEKKADTEVSAATNLSDERLFNCLNYCLECLGLIHCQVGQNLAVQRDAFGVELADKL